MCEYTSKVLLIKFFKYFATQFNYNTDCVCVRLGQIIPKQESPMFYTTTPQLFCVEDPLILSENCARTVAEHSLPHIRAEFNRAYVLLSKATDFAIICEIPKQKRKQEVSEWQVEDENNT